MPRRRVALTAVARIRVGVRVSREPVVDPAEPPGPQMGGAIAALNLARSWSDDSERYRRVTSGMISPGSLSPGCSCIAKTEAGEMAHPLPVRLLDQHVHGLLHRVEKDDGDRPLFETIEVRQQASRRPSGCSLCPALSVVRRPRPTNHDHAKRERS